MPGRQHNPTNPVEHLAHAVHAHAPADPQIVHFIRHGEGFHNVAGQADPDLYRSWTYEDAHLTDKGWAQVCAGLRVCWSCMLPGFACHGQLVAAS